MCEQTYLYSVYIVVHTVLLVSLRFVRSFTVSLPTNGSVIVVLVTPPSFYTAPMADRNAWRTLGRYAARFALVGGVGLLVGLISTTVASAPPPDTEDDAAVVDLAEDPIPPQPPVLPALAPGADHVSGWLALTEEESGAAVGGSLSYNALVMAYADVQASSCDGRLETAVTNSPRLRAAFDLLERDVPRTLSRRASAPLTGRGADDRPDALRRLLAAYAVADEEVGYVQGMSFVCAFLLRNSSSEHDAYALLVRLMRLPRFQLRRMYSPGLPLVASFGEVVRCATVLHAPALAAHLAAHGVAPILYHEFWLTLFTYGTLDEATTLSVWGAFLRAPAPYAVLVRVCLVLLDVVWRRVHAMGRAADFAVTVSGGGELDGGRWEWVGECLSPPPAPPPLPRSG